MMSDSRHNLEQAMHQIEEELAHLAAFTQNPNVTDADREAARTIGAHAVDELGSMLHSSVSSFGAQEAESRSTQIGKWPPREPARPDDPDK